MSPPHIMILGIGCILYRDEGFGVRVVERLGREYRFPDNVSLIDGGVLGVNLLGYMANADRLIVVDCIRNQGKPGDIHRLEQHELPERILAKNSLHQVDFLEALTLCTAIEKVPQTVVIGVEPEDIETLCTELTPTIEARIEPVMGLVLSEIERLGYPASPKSEAEIRADASCIGCMDQNDTITD
ncbi:HyaD/HybD family hydrogenase maturation endopeptidase [Desulfatirhabdium butyrativorans]|uniref:HyaD/HybD family hydrogenase maturation endopeptidase n=1 Tax=Desulfatirhabdium butyrativorans TaxID=340467 RepID=UPI000427F732|nr:HyaD/HybD family hydrogenase maturation endopeptidase [Desulfatirhabdium butyrativorans]